MFKYQFVTTCRTNLAEIPINQALVTIDKEIQPYLYMMTSNRKTVQREGKQCVAIWCISKQKIVADNIIQYGSHRVLISLF